MASPEVATFCEAITRAFKKSSEVRNTEQKFHSSVETACKKLKIHDRKNKVNQTCGSILGLCVTAAAIPTGGAALYLTPFVDGCKARADSTAMEKACKHWNIGCTALNQHHKAREEFLDALIEVETAKDVLTQRYPVLKQVSAVELWAALACADSSWTIHDVLMCAISSSTTSTPYPGPTQESVTELALQLRNVSLDLAVASGASYEAAMASFEVAVEELVYVGMIIQGANLGMAAKALGTASTDAIELRKIYEASDVNLTALRVYLDQYS